MDKSRISRKSRYAEADDDDEDNDPQQTDAHKKIVHTNFATLEH